MFKVYKQGSCVVCSGDWVVDAGACEGVFLYVPEKRPVSWLSSPFKRLQGFWEGLLNRLLPQEGQRFSALDWTE